MIESNGVVISRPAKPVIGGLLSIVSAIITILFVLVVFIIEYNRYLSGELSFPPGTTYFTVFSGLRIVWLIASILAIAGGILAIRRKYWLYSLIGTGASILCIPGVLGVIATTLVAVSKKEFDRKTPVISE